MSVVGITVGAMVAGAAGWMAAPFVGVRRGGTLDERRRAAIRDETRRVATLHTGAVGGRRGPIVAAFPAPRSAPDAVASPRATPA